MTILHDLRFACRSMAKRPGFSITIVLILGLGLGAATAIVDAINLLAWRMVEAEQPERLVRVYTRPISGFAGPWGGTSYLDYLDYREATSSFTSLAAHLDIDLHVDSGDSNLPRPASAVSPGFFETLGLTPHRGSFFEASKEKEGRLDVVLSHSYWKKMGHDVGSTIDIEGQPFKVLGVAPESFAGHIAGAALDFYVPIESLPRLSRAGELLTHRSRLRFYMTGRLAPGKTRADAQAEMAVLAKRLDTEYPLTGNKPRLLTTTAARLAHPVDLDRLRPTLRLFSVAVGLLLLITCANVAHLLLAQAAARRQEMAVRQSLGAARGVLVRQLLTENLLLALLGAACGVALAWWGRGFLAAFGGQDLAAQMKFDWRVLGAAFSLCLASTLLFGLAPALATSRVRLRAALAAATPGGGGGRSGGGWLAGLQVALSVVLLSSGALLTLSLSNRLGADLGFDDENLLIAAVNLPEKEYTPEEGRLFFEQLRDRAAALPGVEKTGLALLVPPLLFDISIPYRLDGETESTRTARLNYVDERYFETLGITLEQGRAFGPEDATGPPVIVVNRAFVEKVWPGEEAIGRRLEIDGSRPGDAGPSFTVVGVVSSVDQFRQSYGGEPILYFSNAQRYRSRQQVVMRSSAEAEAVFAALRQELRAMDPGLSFSETLTGEDHRRFAFTFERMQASAIGLFGGAGLLLSVIGLFAVLSYGVSRRIRAIGIRMALGARGQDIRFGVVREGLRLTILGSTVGLLALLAASKHLETLLFDVSAHDVRVLGAVVLTVLCAAALAAYLPARRASKLDPLKALRHE